MPTLGMCSPNPYFPGKRYLVMPHPRGDGFADGDCFSGRDVTDIAEEMAVIRNYFKGQIPLHIRGHVAVAPEERRLDYLLSHGGAKALAGVRLTTSRDGQVFTTTTDKSGHYQLNLPAPGEYKIRLDFELYDKQEHELSVQANGCQIEDFTIQPDNTVSGRVWDERGQPITDANVALIDLEAPQSSKSNWLDTEYTKEPGASFQFKNVPLGRYLVMFNPGGPGGTKLGDSLPFERTYHPGASSRVEARPIEIKSNGTHLRNVDVVIGKRVQLREVSVQVTFPDGKPMDHALVECTGAAVAEGDLPWRYEATAGQSGRVTFRAPANQPLRIEVKDSFERDLGSSYVSSHEPGPAPIKKEFVIVP